MQENDMSMILVEFFDGELKEESTMSCNIVVEDMTTYSDMTFDEYIQLSIENVMTLVQEFQLGDEYDLTETYGQDTYGIVYGGELF